MPKLTFGPAFTLTAICTFLLLPAFLSLSAQVDLGSMAINSLRQRADAGEVAAEVELGDRYYIGKGGVAQDYAQSWTWYQSAAEKGNASAEDMIGISYLSGTGVKQDFAQARAWFQKAANEGYAPAQSNLGFLYERGLGGAQDHAQARYWYQKAADQGYASAKRSLAALNPGTGNSPPGDASRPGPVNATIRDENNPAEQATSNAVDVRFTQADSRMLSNDEMAALRDSLHWDPDSVPLPSGGTAVSYLVDEQGHRLGSIRVQWTKTVVPRGNPSQPGEPPVGTFALQMENGTSCGFLGQAELDDLKGSVIVSSLDLDSWVGLRQPGSGQTIRVEGNADLPSPNPKIVLKPLAVSSTLNACMTPKNPVPPESKEGESSTGK